MRSGCLNLAFTLVVASVATALIVLGAVLLFSFVALTFGPSGGVEAVLKATVAVVAAYFFVRVGRSVWRDMREYRPKAGSGEIKREGRVPSKDD